MNSTCARIAARTDRNSGSRREAIEIFIPCLRKVAIEHRVCRRSLIEMDQIHQRKGEIVENIRRRDNGIEFDGIEQQRPAVHQRDVGEMQIAVATAHEPLRWRAG